MNTPSTEARAALTKLLKDKTAIQDQLDYAAAQLKVVRTAEKAEHAARTKLDELAASEAAGTAAWSQGKASQIPVVNSKDRVALESELRSARAKADEIRAAAAPMTEAVSQLGHRLLEADREIQLAKVAVLVETMAPVLDRLETVVREVTGTFAEVIGAADFLVNTAREVGRLDTANPDLELARPMLAAAERLRERSNNAMGKVQYGLTRFPDHSRWQGFLAALSHDAATELDAA